MSTSFYWEKKDESTGNISATLIGVRTFEQKRRHFAWAMNPMELAFNMSYLMKIVDEYGKVYHVSEFIQEMVGIQVMRYDESEVLE